MSSSSNCILYIKLCTFIYQLYVNEAAKTSVCVYKGLEEHARVSKNVTQFLHVRISGDLNFLYLHISGFQCF